MHSLFWVLVLLEWAVRASSKIFPKHFYTLHEPFFYMSKTIVISVGGSLIVPNDIDTSFLKAFTSVIRDFVKDNNTFALFCGGGKVARKYIESAQKIRSMTNEQLDWLGIKATQLNAQLMKTLLEDIADPKIIQDPTRPYELVGKVVVASGWKPGWSTDYDAVLLGKQLGVEKIVNMSDTTHVFDKDPRKYKDAQPLETISWKQYRNMCGDKWTPGLSMPFDPIAAREAEKENIKVHIIGKDIHNLRKCLGNNRCEGTVIS